MMGRKAPETCTVVIPTKLEFSAPVGFIHKGSHSNVLRKLNPTPNIGRVIISLGSDGIKPIRALEELTSKTLGRDGRIILKWVLRDVDCCLEALIEGTESRLNFWVIIRTSVYPPLYAENFLIIFASRPFKTYG
jgi:hypothetical protein